MDIKNLIFNNFTLKVFSILFAFLIFIAIHLAQNKRVIQVIKLKVSLSIPENYVLTSDLPEEVSILVNGRKSSVSKYNKKNLSLLLETNTSKIVQITKDIIPEFNEFNVVQITPSSVNINIEKLVEKKVKIILSSINDLPEGYEYKQKPTIQPQEINILGPQSYINLIEHVYTVSFDQKNIVDTNHSMLKVKAGSNLVKFKDNINIVKVDYDIIEKKVKKEFTDIPIQFLNCELDKNKITPLKKTVNFTTQIPFSILQTTGIENFSVYVDLTDCNKFKKIFTKDISVVSINDKVDIEYISPDSIVFEKKIITEE